MKMGAYFCGWAPAFCGGARAHPAPSGSISNYGLAHTFPISTSLFVSYLVSAVFQMASVFFLLAFSLHWLTPVRHLQLDYSVT